MYSTFESNCEIVIYLVPVGECPPHTFQQYARMMSLHRYVPISGLNRPANHPTSYTPFPQYDWNKGHMIFKFATSSEEIEECVGDEMQVSRKVIGVVGLCHCPSVSNFMETYELFKSSLKNMPDLQLQKCFAFEHAFDRSFIEDTKDLEDVILFPDDKSVGDERRSSISIHMEVVMNTLATSIFSIFEENFKDNDASAQSQTFLLGTDLDFDALASETKKRKHRFARRKKFLGDICLMVNSPSDALVHYDIAIEQCKYYGDYLWLAGALEGYSVALWRQQINAIIFPDEFGFVKINNLNHQYIIRGSGNLSQCLDDVLEKGKEALNLYTKLGCSEFELQVLLKLAWYICLSPSSKISVYKIKVIEFIYRSHRVAPDLTWKKQLALLIESASLCEVIGFSRKSILYLHEASLLCFRYGLWNWAYDLEYSNLTLIKAQIISTFNPLNLLKLTDRSERSVCIPKSWSIIQALILQHLIFVARKMKNDRTSCIHSVELLERLAILNNYSSDAKFVETTDSDARLFSEGITSSLIFDEIKNVAVDRTSLSLSLFDIASTKSRRRFGTVSTPKLIQNSRLTPRLSLGGTGLKQKSKRDLTSTPKSEQCNSAPSSCEFSTFQLEENEDNTSLYSYLEVHGSASLSKMQTNCWQKCVLRVLETLCTTLPITVTLDLSTIPQVLLLLPKLNATDTAVTFSGNKKDNSSAFFYSPFERRSDKEDIYWVQDELQEVICYVSNPYGIPLVLTSIKLVLEDEFSAECYSTTAIIPSLTTAFAVTLTIKPLQVGKLKISGCEIRPFNFHAFLHIPSKLSSISIPKRVKDLQTHESLLTKNQVIVVIERLPLLVLREEIPLDSHYFSFMEGENRSFTLVFENRGSVAVNRLNIILSVWIRENYIRRDQENPAETGEIESNIRIKKKLHHYTQTLYSSVKIEKDVQYSLLFPTKLSQIFSWKSCDLTKLNNRIPLKTGDAILLPLTITASRDCEKAEITVYYSNYKSEERHKTSTTCTKEVRIPQRKLSIPITMDVGECLRLLSCSVFSECSKLGSLALGHFRKNHTNLTTDSYVCYLMFEIVNHNPSPFHFFVNSNEDLDSGLKNLQKNFLSSFQIEGFGMSRCILPLTRLPQHQFCYHHDSCRCQTNPEQISDKDLLPLLERCITLQWQSSYGNIGTVSWRNCNLSEASQINLVKSKLSFQFRFLVDYDPKMSHKRRTEFEVSIGSSEDGNISSSQSFEQTKRRLPSPILIPPTSLDVESELSMKNIKVSTNSLPPARKAHMRIQQFHTLQLEVRIERCSLDSDLNNTSIELLIYQKNHKIEVHLSDHVILVGKQRRVFEIPRKFTDEFVMQYFEWDVCFLSSGEFCFCCVGSNHPKGYNVVSSQPFIVNAN